MCNSTLLGRGKTLFTQTLEEDMMMCSLAERCDELQETCDYDPTVVFPGLGCFLMRFFSLLSLSLAFWLLHQWFKGHGVLLPSNVSAFLGPYRTGVVLRTRSVHNGEVAKLSVALARHQPWSMSQYTCLVEYERVRKTTRDGKIDIVLFRSNIEKVCRSSLRPLW